MDVSGTLAELRAHRDKLAAVIKELESLNSNGPLDVSPRRGRRYMPEAERREVSARMKRYWASRRQVQSRS